MNYSNAIFREYDIRGVADKEFDDAFAETLGLAYAMKIRSEVQKQGPLTVSVGRDCRLTSDRYAAKLISGLLKGGLDVMSLGVCPTPATYFSIFNRKLDGGIMVTGSHNPAEYNGFKISLGKSTLHGDQIQSLRVLIEKGVTQAAQPGKLIEKPIIAEYIDFLAQAVKPGAFAKKVVLDAGNGTAGNVAPEVFKRLGAQVIPLFCELDGRFPNHHPDPTVPKNLAALVEKVRTENADFGIAFDGDSDRIGLVDETGRVIFGDEIMVIFSRAVLKQNKGATIISEVKSSFRLYDDIQKNGGNGIMWKTGHSLIKSKMKESGALLAGEMSGHIFFADRYFGFDDAIYAAARLYEIATQTKEPISTQLAGLPSTHATPEIRVDCVEDLKFTLVDAVKSGLAKSNKINDIDGVRVDFGDGWGLVRASNTQPVLVLRFEATSQNRLNSIQALVLEELRTAAKKVGHPEIQVK